MKTKLMTVAVLMILFNNMVQAEWNSVRPGEEAETPAPNPAGEITNLTAEEVEKAKNEEDRKRFEEAAKLLEAETKRIAEEEAQRQAEEEEKRKAAEAAEARANDYPELSLAMAKVLYLLRDDPENSHRTFSFYPEVSGWHIFQTYGPSDTVMEIYHNEQSIVNTGKSDGDDGDDNNELQHKYLEAGERYVIQVYLQSKSWSGKAILNVRAEEPFREYESPLTVGLAKKFWLSTDDYDQTHFTTTFTPETTGRYNIETYSADEDTVMEIYHPDGYSMVASGESDGDRGVDDEELQVKTFEVGKTYTIQVYMEDFDNDGYAWVHVWRSPWNPLTLAN